VLINIGVDQAAEVLFGTGYTRPGHVTRAIASFALYVPLVVGARRFLDRRPLSGLGLDPLRTAWRPLLVGMAAWSVPAAIGIALVIGLGWSQVTLQGSFGALAAVVGLRFVLVLLFEEVPEELLFRGYLYHNLAIVVPRWVAVVGQAVLFVLWGWIAGAAATVDRILLFLVFSLILGVIRVRTGTVWATIGFHLAFQTVAQVTGPVETVFGISDIVTLQAVAFGLVPFALGVLTIERRYRTPPAWRDRETEPHPVGGQQATV
jgi:membrane protease YdiL (CAAX protease family)